MKVSPWKIHHFTGSLEYLINYDGEYEERDTHVEYTFTPGQAAIMYGDNASPAEGPEMFIEKITIEDQEVTDNDEHERYAQEFLDKHFDEMASAAMERPDP